MKRTEVTHFVRRVAALESFGFFTEIENREQHATLVQPLRPDGVSVRALHKENSFVRPWPQTPTQCARPLSETLPPWRHAPRALIQ